jgi:predicted enzyme related to lactoylglutathione lyase
MPVLSRVVPGNFCWVEANVDRAEREKGFYAELFGWRTESVKFPVGDYTLLKRGEDPIGGMYELPAEAKAAGARPYWLGYVAVADIAEATGKAEQLGAHVFKAPFDAGPGKMSLIGDPTGAVLALWQSLDPMGTFVWRETNSMSWLELTTTNTALATKFYVEMFGWRTEVVSMGEFDYTLLYNGQEQIAGLMPQPKPMVEAKAPSFWTVYFEVADCDATATRAKQLGGDIVMPPTDIPNVGRFAVLKDVDGAAFAIIKNKPRP